MKNIQKELDRFNFSEVYNRLGKLKGYSFLKKDSALTAKIVDLEHELDKALGYD